LEFTYVDDEHVGLEVGLAVAEVDQRHVQQRGAVVQDLLGQRRQVLVFSQVAEQVLDLQEELQGFEGVQQAVQVGRDQLRDDRVVVDGLLNPVRDLAEVLLELRLDRLVLGLDVTSRSKEDLRLWTLILSASSTSSESVFSGNAAKLSQKLEITSLESSKAAMQMVLMMLSSSARSCFKLDKIDVNLFDEGLDVAVTAAEDFQDDAEAAETDEVRDPLPLLRVDDVLHDLQLVHEVVHVGDVQVGVPVGGGARHAVDLLNSELRSGQSIN